MKKIFIILSAAAISCTKQNIEVHHCASAWYIAERWTDSASGKFIRRDTLWPKFEQPPTVCDSNLERMQAVKPFWKNQCGQNPPFWELDSVIIKY